MHEKLIAEIIAMAMSPNNSPSKPFRNRNGIKTMIVVSVEPMEERETSEVAIVTSSR